MSLTSKEKRMIAAAMNLPWLRVWSDVVDLTRQPVESWGRPFRAKNEWGWRPLIG